MHGIVIALNGSRTADIYAEHSIYQAKLSPDLEHVKPGDSVEIAPSQGAAPRGRQAAAIESVEPLPLPSTVAWSENARVPDHQLMEHDSAYRLAAEGPDFKSCYQLLADEALKCEANALLNCEGAYVRRPLSHQLLCRISAMPAQVKGPDFEPKPGLHLKLPVKRSRRNSPNGAQLRYVRVLLVCLLLIAEPCLARLGALGTLPLLAAQIMMAALPLLCLIAAVFYNPRRKVVYLLRERPSRLKFF